MMKPGTRAALTGLFLLGLLALIALVYRPTLNGGWNFDDLGHIVNNPAVLVPDLSWRSLRAVADSPLKNRPLSYLTFALDFHRAGITPEARAFHLTNLFLHLAATILIWLLLRALFQDRGLKGRVPWPRGAALAGAFVWGLHPIQFQSVAYVVQRMNLLAGLFTFAAVLLWLRARRQQRPGPRIALNAGAGLAAALGLLAKENTAALAFLLPALDRSLSGLGLRAWASKRRVMLLLLLAAFALLAAVYAAGAGGLLTGYQERPYTLTQRLLTQPRVVLWYATVWVFPAPVRLSLEHEFALSTGPFTPWTTIPAIVLLFGLSLLALFKAERAPLLCLGWLWFVLGLALESSILPLEMVFEHRLYLPGLGLILAATDLVARLRPSRRWLPLLLAFLAIIALAAFARGRAWQNEIAVWRDAVRKAPGHSRPWSNLCAFYFSYNLLPPAEQACRQSARVNPRDPSAWYNLGLALYGQGRFQEAEQSLGRALARRPDWAEALYQRGRALGRLGDFAGAEALLQKAASLTPDDPVYWYQLALTELTQGKKAEGRTALLQARRLAAGAPAEVRADVERALRMLGSGE